MDPTSNTEHTTNRTSTAVAGAALLISAASPSATPPDLASLSAPIREVTAQTTLAEVEKKQFEFPAYFRPAVAVINLASATRQALKKFINDTSLPQAHMGLAHKVESSAINIGPFLKVLNRVSNRLEIVFEQGATPEPESLGIRSVAVHLQANLEVFSAHIRQLSENNRLPYSERDHACQSAIQLKAAVAQMILKVEAIMNGVGEMGLESDPLESEQSNDHSED